MTCSIFTVILVISDNELIKTIKQTCYCDDLTVGISCTNLLSVYIDY